MEILYKALITRGLLFNLKTESVFSLFNLKTETLRKALIYNTFLFNSEIEIQLFKKLNHQI